MRSLLAKVGVIIKADTSKIALTALILFLVVLPLSQSINFSQNDDWIYYKAVESFLQGNFTLDHYIEATFYTQGLLGMVYAQHFGVESLPVLTLIVSVGNFFIFTYILYRFFIKKLEASILIGLLFFFNPYHIYATLGFMTDAYFVFITLLTFLFIELFTHSEKKKYFVLLNLTALIGFFLRQLSVVSSIALIVYLIIKKKYKWAIFESALVVGLLIYYATLFPKTEQMEINHEFVFSNLLNLQKSFTITFTGLLTVFIFIAPLPFILLNKFLKDRQKKLLSLVLITSATLALYLTAMSIISPLKKEKAFMYYMENAVERNGFFHGDSMGQKYSIQNEETLYYILDMLTKVSLCLTIIMAIIMHKKLVSYYSIFMLLYLGVMDIMIVLYDRYYLILIPTAIFALFSITPIISKPVKIFLVIFLGFVIFYSYNISNDFVLLNNKMWDISRKLVSAKNVKETQISAGYAWRRTYYNEQFRYKYMFYFEPKTANPDIECCFKLLQTEKLDFPFSMFEDAKIFLYKRQF